MLVIHYLTLPYLTQCTILYSMAIMSITVQYIRLVRLGYLEYKLVFSKLRRRKLHLLLEYDSGM